MSKEVERFIASLDGGFVEVVEARDYEALLAERDRMAEALKSIDEAYWSSSESATDFAISQAKGLLIGKMKRIAAAALQGAQP